jgi:hypothetical protein
VNRSDDDFENDAFGDGGWNMFDEIDEDLESAELTVQRTKKKLFEHWTKIASACYLLNDLLLDDDLDVKEKAELEARAKKKYPGLIKINQKYSSVFSWMNGRSLALDDWYNLLSQPEKALLDTPAKIKSHFEKNKKDLPR